jgi:hypothetical protein
VFFGNHVQPPECKHAISDDPMLMNPGIDKDVLSSLEGD